MLGRCCLVLLMRLSCPHVQVPKDVAGYADCVELALREVVSHPCRSKGAAVCEACRAGFQQLQPGRQGVSIAVLSPAGSQQEHRAERGRQGLEGQCCTPSEAAARAPEPGWPALSGYAYAPRQWPAILPDLLQCSSAPPSSSAVTSSPVAACSKPGVEWSLTRNLLTAGLVTGLQAVGVCV